jgi:hypothetical protein
MLASSIPSAVKGARKFVPLKRAGLVVRTSISHPPSALLFRISNIKVTSIRRRFAGGRACPCHG